MATSSSSPPPISLTNRPTFSCIRCGDRKVKCDRQKPCGACVRHKVECVFNTSQPPRKRQKQKRVKDRILMDRVKQLEALLQEQGIDPDKLPDTPDSEPIHLPQNLEPSPTMSVNKPHIVYGDGRFKFVDNPLWTRVVEEFDPEDALEDSSDDESYLEGSDDDLSYVLSIPSKSTPRFYHPPPEHIHQLWQVFLENIDPLTKVVHVPTLRPAFQKAAGNLEAIPRTFEAFMFSVYAAAIMSLKDDECRQRFDESRQAMLSRYISATKIALSRAKFMGTSCLIVLQALILHILSVRGIYEPRVIWSLTGVAVRIAQGMGLERDGSLLSLPPFESEIRRRVWWLLKTHDYRAAELCGLPKFRDLDLGPESTKFPTNVNDDQLYPGMPEPVNVSNKLTDAVFAVFKYELASFAASRIAKFREQGKSMSQWNLNATGNELNEADQAFRKVEELLETKYLRYCDPSRPLHLMVMVAARLSINTISFLSHHPRRWASIEETPAAERQWVWDISINLLEQQNMVLSNPQLKRFAWQAAYFQQWHAFIHILDTLRVSPLMPGNETAWKLIGDTYENTPEMTLDMRKPIHVAVGNLCLKAYSDREAALQKENLALPPKPQFISQLHQQREVTQTKKKARDAKINRANDQIIQDHVTIPNSDILSHTLESTRLQQSAISQSSDTQIGGAIDSDQFWIMNGWEGNQSGNLDDVMNLDPISMLPHDQLIDNSMDAVSWEQWDSWLADSNAMRPLSSARESRYGT